MRILVCGDRNWSNATTIWRELDKFENPIIIEGEQRGADSFAAQYAESKGLELHRYPANWKKMGRAAGPIRNCQMLTEGKPDLVLAFHPNLEESRGTRDMVNRARKMGVEVRVFNY